MVQKYIITVWLYPDKLRVKKTYLRGVLLNTVALQNINTDLIKQVNEIVAKNIANESN